MPFAQPPKRKLHLKQRRGNGAIDWGLANVPVPGRETTDQTFGAWI